MTQPALLAVVQSSCVAYLPSHRCQKCRSPARLRTRSDYTLLVPRFSAALAATHQCEQCTAQQRNAAAEVERAEAARHGNRVATLLGDIEAALIPVDYANLDDVLAFFLYVALASAGLGQDDVVLPPLSSQLAKLAPTEDLSTLAYNRLSEAGIIVPCAAADPQFVTVSESGQAGVIIAEVPWRLANDAGGYSIEQVMAGLADRMKRISPHAAEEIWYLIAESECKRYFVQQCERYRFSKPELFNDKVALVVREFLHVLSIGQLWNIIYYSLKDLAALAQEKSHARQNVYNMIPGTIRRYCEYRISNFREIRPWSRPPLATESWMTTILLDKVLGNGNAMFERLAGSQVVSQVSRCTETPPEPAAPV